MGIEAEQQSLQNRIRIETDRRQTETTHSEITATQGSAAQTQLRLGLEFMWIEAEAEA